MLMSPSKELEQRAVKPGADVTPKPASLLSSFASKRRRSSSGDISASNSLQSTPSSSRASSPFPSSRHSSSNPSRSPSNSPPSSPFRRSLPDISSDSIGVRVTSLPSGPQASPPLMVRFCLFCVARSWKNTHMRQKLIKIDAYTSSLKKFRGGEPVDN